MLAILVISLASSIEIPIHFAEIKGFHNIPALSLINKDNVAPVYLSNSIEFYAKAKVGGQNVNLVLDLNVDESIVALSQCACTKNAPLYNPYSSWGSSDVSTSTNSYDTTSNKYKLYKDDVALGSFTAYDQFFLAATKHSKYGEPLSGSLGLNDASNNNKKQNFVQNLYDQRTIKSPVFSLTLMNPFYPEHSSVLTIGDYDFSKYSTGAKTVIRSDNIYGAWSTSVSSFKLDSTTYSSRKVPALFIPSVWVMVLPPTEHQQLMNKIKSKFQCGYAGFDFCLCNSANDVYLFPQLSFTIDGNSYTISPENYVVYSSEGYCIIAALDLGIDAYFLGAPFFYEYYSVFDMNTHQITLAKATYFANKESSGSSGYVTYSAFGLVGAAGIGFMAWKAKKNREESIESYQPFM